MHVLQDLDDVLVRDVGGKLAGSGKWPLIIDTSGQVRELDLSPKGRRTHQANSRRRVAYDNATVYQAAWRKFFRACRYISQPARINIH